MNALIKLKKQFQTIKENNDTQHDQDSNKS